MSFTYNTFNTTQPPYLYDLVSIQPPHGHNTRSSPYVTNHLHHSKSLIAPSRHASRHLWNQLTTSLRIPVIQITHPPLSDLHLNMPV